MQGPPGLSVVETSTFSLSTNFRTNHLSTMEGPVGTDAVFTSRDRQANFYSDFRDSSEPRRDRADTLHERRSAVSRSSEGTNWVTWM